MVFIFHYESVGNIKKPAGVDWFTELMFAKSKSTTFIIVYTKKPIINHNVRLLAYIPKNLLLLKCYKLNLNTLFFLWF